MSIDLTSKVAHDRAALLIALRRIEDIVQNRLRGDGSINDGYKAECLQIIREARKDAKL